MRATTSVPFVAGRHDGRVTRTAFVLRVLLVLGAVACLVSLLEPLVLNATLSVPPRATAAELAATVPAAPSPVRLAACDLAPAALADGQWTAEKAWQWYDDQPWLVGCNFLPSTAVNDVEMWQDGTFDAVTIDRELGWAHDIGFNTVRVFLNFVVWQDDPEGLRSRFGQFLQIANRHQISVMPILFDDCNFANRVAAAGRQPPPVPGVHNSQWVSSPPLSMVTDRDAWPALERYTKDLVGTFGQDPRVVVWDLYNEPGNSRMGAKSRPLVEAAFRWARAVQPRQPLTIAAWTDFEGPFSRRMMELSDVVSFHGYDTLPGMRSKLAICRQYDRPILCTEWLHRQSGNTVETILPLFQAQRIGCYNWGLVSGRTQTYMPWGSEPGDPVPDVWQHDLLHPDGRPYQADEVARIRELVDKSKQRARDQP